MTVTFDQLVHGHTTPAPAVQNHWMVDRGPERSSWRAATRRRGALGSVLRFGLIVPLTALILGWTADAAAGARSKQREPDRDCTETTRRSWTPQESWVWERLCDGTIADLDAAGAFGPRTVPGEVATWNDSRAISSEFLCTILLNEPYVSFLDGKRVWIKGAWYRDHVELADVNIPVALFLDNSRFEGTLTVEGSRISGRFSVSDSVVAGGLNLHDTTVDGSIYLGPNSVYAWVAASGLSTTGSVLVEAVKVTAIST